ncbi:shikimate kinase [candidate division FCPU426 bacterium]|nr:shikimate kinase [candidate division FCPU426 bacterium]
MKGVVLVGFMGTGKTVVGRLLADRLQVPLLDTDECIVKASGKSITAIFAEEGEPCFRNWETRVLEQLAADSSSACVVATGGGIVTIARNWPLLRKLGAVICLQAEPETIWERVGNAPGRPLLAGTRAEVKQRIDKLLAAREEAYAQADFTCVTDRRSPEDIAADIVKWLQTRAA